MLTVIKAAGLARLTAFRFVVDRFIAPTLCGKFSARLALVIACVFHATHLFSLEITIRDQHGNPLPDAVLVLPGVAYDVAGGPEIVDQVDRRFLPSVVAIPIGQSVSFPNSDDIRHHVYSFSKSNPFEIRLYTGVSVKPIKFEQPGLVVIGCNIHDNMVGYIFVSKEWASVSDADGRVTVPEVEFPEQLGLWHPRQYDALDSVSFEPLKVWLEHGEAQSDTGIQLVLKVRPPKKEKKKATFKSRFSTGE